MMSASAPDPDDTVKATAEARFDWEDPLGLHDQLLEDERLTSAAAHEFCQERLMPRVLEAHRHEHFDRAIMRDPTAR